MDPVGLLRDDQMEPRRAALSPLPDRVEQTGRGRGLVRDDEDMGRL
jgi:hypothetical protein